MVQCQADKIEIMRDLATYEVNFAQNIRNPRGQQMKPNLLALEEILREARVKLTQNVAFDEEGEAYFTHNNVEEIDNNAIEQSYKSL